MNTSENKKISTKNNEKLTALEKKFEKFRKHLSTDEDSGQNLLLIKANKLAVRCSH